MPPFFVPGVLSPGEAERAFQQIRAHVVEHHAEPLDEEGTDRLFLLVHVGAAKHTYQVGEPNPANGLIISAIFEAFGPVFHVCSRVGDGVVVHPVTLESDDVVRLEAFEGVGS